PLALFHTVVRRNNLGNDRISDHIIRRKLNERDIANAAQNLFGLNQALGFTGFVTGCFAFNFLGLAANFIFGVLSFVF
ncbi:hypothetical protein NBA66_24245, partial [Salmonella sp. NW1267]